MERALHKVAELLSFTKYRGLETTFTNMQQLYDTSLKTDQLVWIYADWCGPCQRSQPSWSNAKELINRNKYPLKMHSIDGSKYADVSKTLKVKGYPTFLLLSKRTDSSNNLTCEATDCRDEEKFAKQLSERYP